jgi:hypothetical protein
LFPIVVPTVPLVILLKEGFVQGDIGCKAADTLVYLAATGRARFVERAKPHWAILP